MKTTFALGLVLGLAGLLPAAQPADTRFLYQPMLIWGNGEVTHQGTGFLAKKGGKAYGVTSIHFMNFEAKGLYEAIWTDIPTGQPLTTFRNSIGKPKVTSIETYGDVAHDFVVMPMEGVFPGASGLELESVPTYPVGTKVWFPSKDPEKPIGYTWIPAQVVGDEGHLIEVKLLEKVKMGSQSGSPFINDATGKVIGLLQGGKEVDGLFVLTLCPARGVLKHLETTTETMPLAKSISKEK